MHFARGSPIRTPSIDRLAADGKLYAVSRAGRIYVFAAKPKFEQIAVNRLESERGVFNGTPAVSHGAIFLRSDRFLYCIGKN